MKKMKMFMSEVNDFPMWRSNRGWRARIGVIYPGGGWSHIEDFYKLAPKGVTIGGAGVPRHKDESYEEMLRLDEWVVDRAANLAAYKPECVIWACTAGSFLKGKGHDERLIKEMEAATGAPCTTTSTAIKCAFEELGIKKFALATPYPHDVNLVEKKFFEDNGFVVTNMAELDIIDNLIIANISPNVLYHLAKAADTPDADAVFISCTGLDTLDIIEPLEYDLGKPVITSNQASYWHAFKLARVGEPIKGYGTLLDRPR
ncbi:MAG: maleate cis-trans isomerase family protein [Oscillospiraceae bacterium]|jgi:maleate isomerase